MEVLKLNQLGNFGLNSDLLPFDLPPEFLSSGDNFRVYNGFLLPFHGSLLISDGPPNESEVGFLKHVRAKGFNYWVLASRTDIWVLLNTNTTGWTKISSKNYALPVGSQHDWIGTQLGQILVMSNVEVSPEYWVKESVSPILEGLPFSPGETWEAKGLRCRSLRAHKNFLIAMNLLGSESSPNGYRISHPSAIDGIPFTWDTTDRSSIAIRGQLGADGGEIVDGRTLRDTFVMYSRDAIDNFDYSPSSEFYWSRKSLSSTVGLLTPKCLTEVKGSHFLMVDGDVVVNDGSSIQSIMHQRILKRFNARVNQYTELNSFVARNDRAKEIWFCVPEEESETASVAYVYNWKDATWSITDLPLDTVGLDFGTLPLSTGQDSLDTWRSIGAGSNPVTWASVSRGWGKRRSGPGDDGLVGSSSSGVLSDYDPFDAIDQPAFNCQATRTDFPLMDHSGTVAVVRVFPIATGSAFIMQVGVQQFAGGPVEWGREVAFNPGADRYFDIRLTGELFCYRIKSIGTNRFRFSGAEIQYHYAGRR